MEEGQMRVEVNISLREAGSDTFGTKVEIKNLNSFSAVEKGIAYEIKRQSALLARGEKVVQETRGWNEAKSLTESQRSKEDAHDYRYLPEPDLPPIDLSAWSIERLREELPELPAAKRARFVSEFGLTPGESEALTEEKHLADYFEAAASEFKERATKASFAPVVNYLLSDLRGFMNERGVEFADLKISPEHFGHFASLIAEGKLSSRLAKNLLGEMAMTGEDPETLMRKSGVSVVADEMALEALAKELVAANPKPATDYRTGKQAALQFFLGQGMAKTKGQADPAKLREAIIEALSQ
jgi:aspartyl-tRNA(Asn)/glutamyl-tRNA(Gln) amidotransferase subunit B